MSANPHELSNLDRTAPQRSRSLSELERRAITKFLNVIGDPPLRIALWDRDAISTSKSAPMATVHVRDRRTLYGLLTNSEIAAGEAYTEGRIEIEGDLPKTIELIFRGQRQARERSALARGLGWLAMRRPRANTKIGSRHNIHQHYDIGNDFYKMWLDDQMQYTCAYFPSSDLTIEQAQVAKLDHICRKLRIKPGDTVVEAGCGWGSLALHIARRYGARVQAFNISHEQIVHARDQVKRAGLDDRVEYVEDDYRNIRHEYDVFVSVGMLEHVGPQNYQELGRVIDRCLKADGRGLIHSIVRNQPRMMNAWIEQRIFPGAYPPTLRQMMDILQPYNLSVLDIENLRLHYAATIEHWFERFQRSEVKVKDMFDEKFMRSWRLYLAGSIAAFKADSLQLLQVLFARGDYEHPWSRDYMYPACRRSGSEDAHL